VSPFAVGSSAEAAPALGVFAVECRREEAVILANGVVDEQHPVGQQRKREGCD